MPRWANRKLARLALSQASGIHVMIMAVRSHHYWFAARRYMRCSCRDGVHGDIILDELSMRIAASSKFVLSLYEKWTRSPSRLSLLEQRLLLFKRKLPGFGLSLFRGCRRGASSALVSALMCPVSMGTCANLAPDSAVAAPASPFCATSLAVSAWICAPLNGSFLVCAAANSCRAFASPTCA